MDGGSLSLHGRLVTSWGPSEWRKKVCYVPQQPIMLPTTVADKLALVSKLHQRSFDKPLAQNLMEQVGLGDLNWSQKTADLSGGQKQRVQESVPEDSLEWTDSSLIEGGMDSYCLH